MNSIIKAVQYWQKMADSVVHLDLTRSCEAPCNIVFTADAVALCYLELESPFKEGSDDDCDWQDMMYFFRLWKKYSGNSDCAYKKRFIKIAKKIVEAHPRCPYLTDKKVSFEQLYEAELTDAEWNDMKSGTYVPVVEPADRDAKIEKERKELDGIVTVGKETADPPAMVFNVFKKRRRK